MFSTKLSGPESKAPTATELQGEYGLHDAVLDWTEYFKSILIMRP